MFTIEHLLENKISHIFKKKSKILVCELSEWMDPKKIIELRDLCSQKKFLKNSFVETKDGENFLLDIFLNNSQFGDTLDLLSMLKVSRIQVSFSEILKDVNYLTLKRWYSYIKDIRNTLAHRTKIDQLHFLKSYKHQQHPINKGRIILKLFPILRKESLLWKSF